MAGHGVSITKFQFYNSAIKAGLTPFMVHYLFIFQFYNSAIKAQMQK